MSASPAHPLLRPRWGPLLLLAALAGLSLAAVPASAGAAASFSCRASAGRSVPGNPAQGTSSEPTVANSANSPCVQGDASGATPTTIGPASAQKVQVQTRSTATSATAAVSNSGVAAAGSGSGLTADTIQASTAATCPNGTPVLSGSSRVTGIKVNGAPLNLPTDTAPATYDLGPLGTLLLNQKTFAGGEVVVRALELRNSSGDSIVGEARSGASGNPCNGSAVLGLGDCARASTCVAPTSTFPATSETNRRDFVVDVKRYAGVSYQCAVDTGAFKACTPPFRFRGLKDGCHIITIKGRDKRGRTRELRRRVCVDTRAPRAALLYPLCRNKTRGFGKAIRVTRCAPRARYWRLVRGRVSDPSVSSGIRSVQVNVVQKRGTSCRGLSGRRLVRMSCGQAARRWVAARVQRVALKRQAYGRFSCKTRAQRRSKQCMKVQNAGWTLRVPLTRGRYVIRVKATDRAGNRQRSLRGRSTLKPSLK